MSTEYQLHVGAYLEVYNPEKPSTTEYYACPKRSCSNFQVKCSTKFCPVCGTAISLVTVPTPVRIKFDVYEECLDNLAEVEGDSLPDEKQDYILFVSNITNGSGISTQGSTLKEVTEKTIKNDLVEFKDIFKGEIIRIKEVFGEDNVKVKWGIIGYWW